MDSNLQQYMNGGVKHQEELGIYSELISPLGTKLLGRSPIYSINPKFLLNPYRLDIVVKYLYALSLLGNLRNLDDREIEKLYEHHIYIRTGGVEPYSKGKKTTIHDYKQSFYELIQSLRAEDFNFNKPIQISGKDGIILDGAHRLAASIALEFESIPFQLDRTAKGRHWDHTWFKNNGYIESEIEIIASGWLRLRENNSNIAIIWPCLKNEFQHIHKKIQRSGDIIFEKKIDLKSNMSEFIYDVYSIQHGPLVEWKEPHIKDKINRLSKYGSEVLIIVFDSNLPSQKIKTQLRKHFEKENLEIFDTVHIPDFGEERDYLKKIVLDCNNLTSYKETKPISKKVANQLNDLQKELKNRSIDQDSVCVVGGSVLELWGIKKADDLDLVLLPKHRHKFETSQSVQLNDKLDLVSENYFRQLPVKDRIKLNDSNLIEQKGLHVYRRGFKFSQLNLVIQKKRFSRRDKDLKDLIKIGNNKLNTNYQYQKKLSYPDSNNLKGLELADWWHKQGVLSKAAKEYKSVLCNDPESIEALCGIGMCALHRGDIVTATQHINYAIEIDPSSKLLKKLKNQLDWEKSIRVKII